MKHFICSSDKINVNKKEKKIEISLTGSIKENGGILLLVLNIEAAPSSSHLLNYAQSFNLLKTAHIICCGPSESLRKDL